jgi:GxxExxY protein
VAGLVIVEIKAVEGVLPIHQAQLLTYLKHSDLWLGLLINFNAPLLKNGLTRILNG